MCFKKEIHNEKHTEVKEGGDSKKEDRAVTDTDKTSATATDATSTTDTATASGETPKPSIYDPLIKDEVIQKLLSYKSTKTHLKHIATLLKDSKLAREATEEGRMEIANLGLLELRAGGENENEAIEEFCQRALDLMEEKGI